MEIRSEIKTVEVKKYVAYDGTEFNDRSECEKYEADTRGRERDVLMNRFLALPHADLTAEEWIPQGGYKNSLYVVKVRNLKDYELIESFIKEFHDPWNENDVSDIKEMLGEGKEVRVIIEYSDDDDIVWYYGTVEEYFTTWMTDFKSAVESLMVNDDDT